MLLEVKDLGVKIGGKQVLNGVNLQIKEGETHVLLGPNGEGKSTLFMTILGFPNYEITNGSIIFKGKDNIVNAIWNGGHHGDIPNVKSVWNLIGFNFKEQDPSHVYLKNITYEVYHDGVLKTVQVYQDDLKNPVGGYENGNAGVNIWQDTLENAQNITIEIYNIEEKKMVFSIEFVIIISTIPFLLWNGKEMR